MLLFPILFFLLLFTFFAGVEVAFGMANKIRLELKKREHLKRGDILSSLYEHPQLFQDTLIVGKVLILVIIVYLSMRWLEGYGASWYAILAFIFLLAVLIIIFSEILSKVFFRPYAHETLYFLAYPIRFFKMLLRPVTQVFMNLAMAIIKIFFKIPPKTIRPSSVRWDFEQFINTTAAIEEGEIIDTALLGKALSLKNIKVQDCMVPRAEIEYIDINASITALEQIFKETKLSRIFITKGDLENVAGYVHHQQLWQQPESIQSILLNITFVPGVMRITDLLNKFVRDRINIACVVDEFGGLIGLITLEDIIEELFGEIEDEHDEEGYTEIQLSENEFILSGRLEINYLNEKYPQLQLPPGDYHTLSGYLVTTTASIPEQDAEIMLNDCKFLLESVSETKIETVRVIKL